MKVKQLIITDIFRVVTSLGFWISIFGISILCIVNSTEFIDLNDTNIDILYIFDNMVAIGSLRGMIILMGAASYVTSFCSDWNKKYIRFLIIRSSVKSYSWSKVIVSSISSFLSVFLGLFLYIAILAIKYPIINKAEGSPSISFMDMKPHGVLLLGDFPILYVLYIILLISIATAFWAVVGLTISSYIPNFFVAIVSPFIASYIISLLTEFLPIWLNLRCLTYAYDVLQKGPGVTLLYTFSLFIILIIIVGIIFEGNIKRRIGDELV